MTVLTHIKHIAFDLDGTLVDSIPGLASAVCDTLSTMSLPVPDFYHIQEWIGDGVDKLLQRAVIWGGNNPNLFELKEIRMLFDQFYAKAATSGTLLYPGVAETLQQLSSMMTNMGIISNKPSRFITPILTTLKIEQYFSMVIGGEDVQHRKPHPEAFFLLLKEFNIPANSLLFVGDSKNDILAAKAAGCISVGVRYGFNFGESIEKEHPDYIINDFPALLTLF